MTSLSRTALILAIATVAGGGGIAAAAAAHHGADLPASPDPEEAR
jgi:hypothetical protein